MNFGAEFEYSTLMHLELASKGYATKGQGKPNEVLKVVIEDCENIEMAREKAELLAYDYNVKLLELYKFL